MATSVGTPVVCTVPWVNCPGSDPHLGSGAELDGIARAAGAKVLVEHIAKEHAHSLVTGRVLVGQVVGDGGQRGGVGSQARERNREIRH